MRVTCAGRKDGGKTTPDDTVECQKKGSGYGGQGSAHGECLFGGCGWASS